MIGAETLAVLLGTLAIIVATGFPWRPYGSA